MRPFTADFISVVLGELHGFRLGELGEVHRPFLGVLKGLAVEQATLALRFVYDKKVVDKIFDDLGPRFSQRPGGYSRLVKIGPRQGDGARMAQIELIGREEV